EQAHVLGALCAVGGGTCAVEELQLGDGARGDEPGCCCLVPSELLGVEFTETSHTDAEFLGCYAGVAVGQEIDGDGVGPSLRGELPPTREAGSTRLRA